jgi:DNA-binding LacI/PurR family transcriptional regulator
MFYLYKGADPVKEKPTVVQIANRSGVSIATVSRVLNGKGTVSPGTRQRVLQAARDLEYDSSTAMPISPSRKLLALLPGFENPFYAPIIHGIQHTAHAAGFELLLMPIGDNGASASSLASLIRKEDYKGIIWLCSAPGPDVLDAVDTLCPSVMIGEYPEDYTGSYVSIDDRSAGYRAVNHLISIGCRRIGMLNCAYRYKYARHRKDGYQRALTEAGLPVEPKLYASIPAIDYTLAYSAAMQILCSDPAPDALFACSDVLAAAAVNAAHSLGLRVPEDLSVIGFDNVETSRMTRPAITTIAQPTHQMGQQACSILLERIQNSEIPHRQILLSTEMVIRGSTK